MATSPVESAKPFWPNADHWSCEIPLDTPHPRLDVLARARLRAAARPRRRRCPRHEYLDLEYMDWKSGGDTNFAPIATADGELDCRGFWNKGDERPDKGAPVHDATRRSARRSRAYVERVGAELRAGAHDQARAAGPRHRVPQLPPRRQQPLQPRRPRVGSCASWLELTDNPDSYMLLWTAAPTGCPIPATEIRVPLHRGARFVRRHPAPVARRRAQRRRAALRADQLFESGPALDRWITAHLP